MGDSTQVSKEADADTMLAPKRRRSRREVPKVSPFIQAFGTSTVSNLLEYLSIIDGCAVRLTCKAFVPKYSGLELPLTPLEILYTSEHDVSLDYELTPMSGEDRTPVPVPPSSALSWLLGRRSSADLLPPLPTEPVKVPLDIPGDDFFVSRKQAMLKVVGGHWLVQQISTMSETLKLVRGPGRLPAELGVQYLGPEEAVRVKVGDVIMLDSWRGREAKYTWRLDCRSKAPNRGKEVGLRERQGAGGTAGP